MKKIKISIRLNGELYEYIKPIDNKSKFIEKLIYDELKNINILKNNYFII